MPRLRGRIGRDEPKVGHADMSAPILEFANSAQLEELAALGTSCPDHFLRTKIRPLIVPAEADDATLDGLLDAYRRDYAGYYERCRHADSPAMRDPSPVVYLLPGVGMITFARDKATARIAGEFYTNAVNVMRGAAGVDAYVGLSEQEAFNIEYWLLEEAKLQRMPKPKPLAGRVALVTGGAGGIGVATAKRLLAEGACVVLTDIDAEALAEAERGAVAAFGRDVVHALPGDVADEAAMAALVDGTVERFGGIDIVVANAGLATAAPFEETSLKDWERNSAVLARGVFLVTRAAYRVMLAQKLGGSIVTICSKNALAASAGASAYCAAKAAALHLTRCLALEGAPHGIRANVVNPDAVLRGSRIWDGDWRQARAESYGVAPDELEEVYRQRSLLKRSVFPEDIAEAVCFLASERAAKSTGNVLNVDAGNAVAFTR
jgi:rhamnulose-1-phosphate aldolase/alcohol dehydrogenase